MARTFLLLIALGVLGAATLASAQAPGHVKQLIQAARDKDLARHPQWIRLGHYLPRHFGLGYKSTIDSAGFFNAPDGKTDPQAELEATLAAFFAEDEGAETEHPQCRFVARYAWLKAQLDFDPARLPERRCPEFESWFANIGPAQLTMVFPSSYLNQPSSMFGHTLLRIDRADHGDGARLGSYAINFGAYTGQDGGLAFAVKGIAGGYPGTFSILPYYEKVKDYSDLENRDIWEYELTLEVEEVRRLVAHVWELRNEYVDYYFFDENCSYHLLSLIEVARPELDLTGRFPLWAIPTDTVRAVVEEAGLLRRAVYRPSSRSEIDHRLRTLGPAQRDLAYDLAMGGIGPDDPALEGLPPAARAAVLELAHEYLQYRFRADTVPRDAAAERSLNLLRARSRIRESAEVPPMPEPVTRPDEGHFSARLSAGFGRLDDRNYVDLRLRPAYHGLLDPQGGFVPGNEISFLDTRLRYFLGQDEPVLEDFTLIGIQSISPRNDFFRPISWRLDVGAERFRRSGPADGEIVGTAGGGAGLSYKLWDGAVVSVFADARIYGSSQLPREVLVGVGPGLEFLYYVTPWYALKLGGAYEFALDWASDDEAHYGLEQSVALSRSLSLSVVSKLRGPADEPFPELAATLHWYF